MAIALYPSPIGFEAVVAFVRRLRRGRGYVAPSAAILTSTPTPTLSSTLKMPMPAGPSAPLSAVDQWGRLSQILTRAATAADTAQRLQLGATQKLDLADYGLTTLVDELSAVMVVPGRKSRQASVHVLASAADPDLARAQSDRRGTALAA